MKVLVAQSCLTHCDPMDYSLTLRLSGHWGATEHSLPFGRACGGQKWLSSSSQSLVGYSLKKVKPWCENYGRPKDWASGDCLPTTVPGLSSLGGRSSISLNAIDASLKSCPSLTGFLKKIGGIVKNGWNKNYIHFTIYDIIHDEIKLTAGVQIITSSFCTQALVKPLV